MKREVITAQGHEVSVDWTENLSELSTRYGISEEDAVEMAMSYILVRGIQAAITRALKSAVEHGNPFTKEDAQATADSYMPGERKVGTVSRSVKIAKKIGLEKLEELARSLGIDISSL